MPNISTNNIWFPASKTAMSILNYLCFTTDKSILFLFITMAVGKNFHSEAWHLGRLRQEDSESCLKRPSLKNKKGLEMQHMVRAIPSIIKRKGKKIYSDHSPQSTNYSNKNLKQLFCTEALKTLNRNSLPRSRHWTFHTLQLWRGTLFVPKKTRSDSRSLGQYPVYL